MVASAGGRRNNRRVVGVIALPSMIVFAAPPPMSVMVLVMVSSSMVSAYTPPPLRAGKMMVAPPPGKLLAFSIAARKVQVALPGAVSQGPLSRGGLATTSKGLLTVQVGGDSGAAWAGKLAPASSVTSRPTRRNALPRRIRPIGLVMGPFSPRFADLRK